MRALHVAGTAGFLVFLLSACAHARPPALESLGLERHTLKPGTQAREFLEKVPAPCRSGGAGKPCALVFVFHGGGGSAAQMAQHSRFHELAAEKGFIVVYPEGLEKSWNDGRPEIGAKEGGAKVDDVAFIDAALADVKSRARVDAARVFATGISNGGFFSFRLACERSAVFKAVAPVVAGLGEAISATCSPGRPVSVLNIVGDHDPLVPYKGGTVSLPFFFARGRGKTLSSDATLAHWLKADGCEGEPARARVDAVKDDGTVIAREIYARCKGGARVVRWVVEGGGHTWPGSEPYARERLIGKTSREVDATREIWAFFDSLL